jgi:hypothetical protein
MRLFQAQLIDRRLEGTGAVAIQSEPWRSLLTRAESLRFFCVADQVSGTSPTLALTLKGSAESSFNHGETTKSLFSQVLSAGINVITASYSPADSYPPPRHLGVNATLTGSSNPVAHVQVWVCGRGPQLLEAIPPVAPTFAAQLAAARKCADEDLISTRKAVLPQGASLFYPPELFQPMLKWDR